MPKQTLSNTSVRDERVLVRVDFNVPLDGRNVADDTRIRAALPTLKHLIGGGNALVVMSHLGRPKGAPDPAFTMAPVAAHLGTLLDVPVHFVPECVGEVVESRAAALGAGEVLVVENVRFHAEETANDPTFAKHLSRLAERTFVNDAFGAAHRAHASTTGVANLLDRAVAGFLMERELAYLMDAMEKPERPFAAVLGGSKVSGKIDVIDALLGRVDRLLIGGAMMFTFLKAEGVEVGRSLVEPDRLDMAARVRARAKERDVSLLLPVDCRVADGLDGADAGTIVPVSAIPPGRMGVDIGPETTARFAEALSDCRTILWNGPMGVFETPGFDAGTLAVARLLADRTRAGAKTIVGGGDSAAAVNQAGLTDAVSHVSTGGGAALELLEGKTLPAIAALSELRA